VKTTLIIPTWNAEKHWPALHAGILKQSLHPNQVIVIDSSSTDRTAALARAAGFTLMSIDRRDFSHGGSRQAAAQRAAAADILIYLTQDATPHDPDSFRNLVGAFRDPAIAAAYGRQIPGLHSSAIEAHARLFNYPPVSRVRSLECRSTLGFKSIFFSNSFGAYRRDALMGVGGFPPDATFGEDTLTVARLHCAGWKTAYVADAVVEHSHALSLSAEFHRYFDIGVFHRREHWLIETFGGASGEGFRFVRSELNYLWKHAIFSIPYALIRTAAKFVAYRLGRCQTSTPPIEQTPDPSSYIVPSPEPEFGRDVVTEPNTDRRQRAG
jgi:rhamnosyltransferase